MATMSRKADELRTTFLECPVCLEEFDEIERKPRSLPCRHCLCNRCTETLIENGKLACPECRAEHKVERNFGNIPFDRTRLRLMEFHKDERKEQILCQCDLQQIATHECRDCELYFCNECLSNHQKRLKSMHTVLILSQGLYGGIIEPEFVNEEYCKRHTDQKLHLYCSGTNCKIPICQVCCIAGHSQGTDHKVQDITEAYENEKKRLLNLVEIRTKKAKKIASDIKEAQAELSHNTEGAITAVETSFDRRHQILERQKNRHIQSIKTKSEQKSKLLQEQEESVVSYTNCVKSDSDLLTQILDASSKVEFLTKVAPISEIFQSTQKQSISKQLVQTAHIEFEERNTIADFTNYTALLGNVLASSLCPQNTRMLLPKDIRQNVQYKIEVGVFDYERNAIKLAGKDIMLNIHPPLGNYISLACVENNKGTYMYSTTWRPTSTGRHWFTGYTDNGKTMLISRAVNVGPELKQKNTNQIEAPYSTPQAPRYEHGQGFPYENLGSEEKQIPKAYPTRPKVPDVTPQVPTTDRQRTENILRAGGSLGERNPIQNMVRDLTLHPLSPNDQMMKDAPRYSDGNQSSEEHQTLFRTRKRATLDVNYRPQTTGRTRHSNIF